MARDIVDLTGRVAVITGGGTGIGAATAHALAEHGAGLVLASRTLDNLKQVADEVNGATGGRCLPVVTDVRQEDDVVALVQRTIEEFGRIDILVNNAGGTRLGPLADMPTSAWDNIFALNLRGPFLLTREAGRYMIQQGSGAIVNISSAAGIGGVRGGAHYASAKAGLQMFTRVTAAEWGPHGIRANCVAVGLVASERAVDAWERAGIAHQSLAQKFPLRRVGWPADVASCVLFLASDAAGYVSGQTFAVDGGPVMEGSD
jgi:NAD(P)-dependent dehydrogenase (short-subunit alcohol dehydrogenase family)